LETSDLKNTDIKEIAEVFVDKRYARKTVGEMEETQQITIFLVLRDDLSVLPQKNTILKLNDIIIIREPDL
jgi:voltage-gated potassium channel